MIRVAHIIETADARAGGTTTAFIGILDALDVLPHDVTATAYFLSPPEGDPMWKRISARPASHRLAASRGRGLAPGELGSIAAADITAGMYDIVHLHGLWCPDLALAAKAAKKAGVPVVWQSHGMLVRWAMNHKKWKKKVYMALGLGRVLRDAAGFICMTREEVETTVFPPTCPPDRRFYVPLPVELPVSPPDRDGLRSKGRLRYSLPMESFVFAFLGRLHPVKRVDLTIEAFAKALPELGDARLLILGKGDTDEYENKLRTRCAELGVTDKVVFGGWLSSEVKPEGLAAADVLVLNSSMESFGYVLFEAMGVGTPVLVSESVALSREFEADGTGVVAPGDAEGLARAMVDISRRTDRDELARRAREWAVRSFSPRAVGGMLVDVYRRASEKK